MKIRCLFTCLVFFPLASGFAASDAPELSSARKTLRYGIHESRIGSFDPHFATSTADRAVADMLFNGLLRYRPGLAPEIEPDLASGMPEMRMTNGKQIWTFGLRKDVLFQPQEGEEPQHLTADDVIFSFQKAANPAFSAYAGEYVDLTFDKLDDHTVRITALKPLSTNLFIPKVTNYAGGFIVGRRAVQSKGYPHFKAHPVGTGPFRFEKYVPGETVVLKAHDRYFRGRPRLAGVEVHLIPDIHRRETALRTGGLDAIYGSGDPFWLKRVGRDMKWSLEVHGMGEVMTVHLNAARKPLDDIRVRKAICYALDREAFVQGTSALLVSEAHSPVPASLMPGGLDADETRALGIDYALNLQKAKSLLKEAGLSDGFTLKSVASDKRIYRVVYDLIQKQLAKAGVRLEVETVPHSEMHKRIRADESDLVVYGAFRPNADVFLTRFFHSDSIVKTGRTPDTNFSHFSGADALIEAARAEVDPERQVRLWKHAQIRILGEAAAYPLFSTYQCQLQSPRLDYGHPVEASLALYPQFTENTRILE